MAEEFGRGGFAEAGGFDGGFGGGFAPDDTQFLNAEPVDEALVDPRKRFQGLVRKSGDILTMNPGGGREDPVYLNVLGQVMDKSSIEQLDGGKQLLQLERKNRSGQRGFGEAVTDIGWKDAPFVGDVVGAAIPIREMRKVVGTLEKIKRGDPVASQDLVYARLYLAEQERQGMSTKWGVLGDVVRGLPTLGAEMWATSQLFGLIGSAAGPEGTAAGAGAGLVAGAAKGAEEVAVKATIGSSIRKFIAENARKALTDYVKKSAAGEAAGETARELGHLGLLKAGLGEIFVKAPIQGLGYTGVDLLANAAVNTATGDDLLASRNMYDKQIQGYMSDDERLVRMSKWLALGDQFVNYYTEMSGEGLSMLTGGQVGLLAKKAAGAATKSVPALAKYRKTLEAVWGTPAELAERRGVIKTIQGELAGGATPESLVSSGRYSAEAVERAKHITTLGMWGLNKMVDNNINIARVANVLKESGYHGWLGEIMEERYGGFLNGIYGSNGGDPGFQNAMQQMWPDRNQLFAEAIGFMIPVATMHAVGRLQSSKALGGLGWDKENLVADAVNNLTKEGGPFVRVVGPGAVTQSTLYDPHTVAVEGIVDRAVAERPTARNDASSWQRLARHALNVANVLTSGNFDMLRTGASFDRLLLEHGVTAPFARATASFMDKETLKEMARLKENPGTDIKDIDYEKVWASEPVQSAARVFVSERLKMYNALRGQIMLRRTELESIAKKEGVSEQEILNQIEKERAAGNIYTHELMPGLKSIVRVTEKGANAFTAEQQALERALGETLRSGHVRNERDVTMDTEDTLSDQHGMDLTDALRRGDKGELYKLAAMWMWDLEKLDDLHEYVKQADALANLKARSFRIRSKDGRENLALAVGNGMYRLAPGPAKEDIVDHLARGYHTLPDMTRDELMSRMQKDGRSPEATPFRIRFTTRQDIVSSDPVRLMHYLGYDSNFQNRTELDKYHQAQIKVERGTANDEEKALVKQLRERAEKALVAFADGEKGLVYRPGKGGKNVWSFTIGAANVPGLVHLTPPGNRKSRAVHVVEDLLEETQKAVYFTIDGPKYRRYHMEYLKRLSEMASSMAKEHRVKGDEASVKLADSLDAISKMLSVVDANSYSDDALSKTVGVMFFGFADASVSGGDRLPYAAGWSVLRRKVMESEGTPEQPGMKLLTAGFLSKYMRDVLGLSEKTALHTLPSVLFPKQVTEGYEIGKVTVRPYQDLLSLDTLRPAGEKALDELGKPDPTKPPAPPPEAVAAKRNAELQFQARALQAAAKARAEEDRQTEAMNSIAPADAGFTSQEEAKKVYVEQRIADETMQEFLWRKMCMSGAAPADGNRVKARNKPK